MRRLGESALRDVVDQLGSRRGERETHRSGAAGDATGATRPWAFGDTEAWSVPRTLLNAQLRRAGGDDRLLDVTDVEIVETEQRTRAAVALCVDTSWSMVQDGRWVPMKRTALALHQLISTRFRGDDLKLITFGRHAREVDLGELIGLEGVWEQGTNLHHALTLAGQHLRRNPDARPVVLVVTDGEPTAHLEPDGYAAFQYPTSPATLHATVAELDRLTALRAAFTFFVLGDDPRLADVHGRHRPPLRRPGGGPDAGRAGRRGGGGLPPQPPMTAARCAGRRSHGVGAGLGVRAGAAGARWLCPECARRHVREIEAKLAPEWWHSDT